MSLSSRAVPRSRLIRSLTFAAALTPVAVALSYGPLSTMLEAQACVPPQGASSGWRTLAFLNQAAEVATDGFVVIAGVSDLEDSELVSSVQVTVRDEQGAEIAGTVTLLSPYPDGEKRRFLGWSASEPLPLEAKLTAKVATERASVGTEPTALRQELKLTVVAEPTALSAGIPSFGEWGTFSRGVGEPVSCMPGSSGCGPGLPPYDLPSPLNVGYSMVPAGEERVRSAMTYWQLPEIRGNVAWEATVVLVGDASGAILPGERPQVFSAAAADAKPPTTGLMIFPAAPEDYCIALRVRDLRTGDEAQSEPVCGEPGASKFTTADTSIRNCAMPPNDALAQTWCEMHPGSVLEQCRPGGSGGTGTVATPEPLPNDADETPAAGMTPSSGSSGGGCSFGGQERSAGSALIGVLGLSLLLRRRRAV